MNFDITNCGNCPMAVRHDSANSESFICSISQAGMEFYNDDSDCDSSPAPEECPLRTEPITLTLI